MENLITWEALELLLDCATDLYKRLHKALYNTEPTEDCARNVARDFCINFLHQKGIYGIKDEDVDEDEADISDDVDESNYNPYTGQDEYDIYDLIDDFDGWD